SRTAGGVPACRRGWPGRERRWMPCLWSPLRLDGPRPAPGAAPDVGFFLWLTEDIHRHSSAAKLHSLLVGGDAEIDPAPADGTADVPRHGVPIALDMNARPQRDHIGVDGHHAAPGGKPKRGHVANRAPVV